MKSWTSAIAELPCHDNITVVEFGIGDGVLTKMLMDVLVEHGYTGRYLGVDHGEGAYRADEYEAGGVIGKAKVIGYPTDIEAIAERMTEWWPETFSREIVIERAEQAVVNGVLGNLEVVDIVLHDIGTKTATEAIVAWWETRMPSHGVYLSDDYTVFKPSEQSVFESYLAQHPDWTVTDYACWTTFGRACRIEKVA